MSSYRDPSKKRQLMKSFFDSQFNHFCLILMYHYQKHHHKKDNKKKMFIETFFMIATLYKLSFWKKVALLVTVIGTLEKTAIEI